METIKPLAAYAGYSLLAFWALWIMFVCVMRLQMLRDAGQLTTGQKVLGYPVLLIGLVLDLALNTVACTVIFLELPQEYTVSARLWRHSTEGDGWRRSFALFVRSQLLDTADPRGFHSG